MNTDNNNSDNSYCDYNCAVCKYFDSSDNRCYFEEITGISMPMFD